MLNIIDSKSLERPIRVGDFFVLNHPIQQSALSSLEQAYPKADLFQTAEGKNDKQYKFSLSKICEQEVFVWSDTNILAAWKPLIDELFSDEYTNGLSQAIDFDLTGKSRSCGFYQQGYHDYIDIHLDKKHKVLTQLFYFNREWNRTYGGDLGIYNENNPQAPLLKLPPLSIYSVIILRTDNSWHGVSKIEQPNFTRNTLQLEYWLNE